MTTARAVRRICSVTVVDASTGRLLPSRDITLDRGRIERIMPARAAVGRADLDGDGAFAIAGLIDTHVHALGVFTDALPGAADLRWMVRQQLRNLANFVRAGVTTIRDLGAPLRLVRRLSRLAERRIVRSPRILFSGPILTVAGGYPYFIPKSGRLFDAVLGPLRFDVRSPHHARRVVRRLARAGVHVIKVCVQSARYDDERSALPRMPRALLRAIVQQARQLCVPTAVHQIYVEDLRHILDLPFDTLEHLPIDAPISDAEAQRIAARRLPVTTTMMTYGIIDHLDELSALIEEPGRFEPRPAEFLRAAVHAMRTAAPVTEHIGRRVIDTGSSHMRASLAKLREAGAVISYGTDSGGAITPTGCPHWELVDMVRAGLSPAEALRAATETAAEAIGRPDLGRLAPGATADIVLLGRNPLQDVTAIADVVAVIQGGRLTV